MLHKCSRTTCFSPLRNCGWGFAGGSKGGTDDLLSVLLQQREADDHSDGEEAPQQFQEVHQAEDGEDSEEEAAAEDPEAQKAEDADVQAQLRSANEVWGFF